MKEETITLKLAQAYDLLTDALLVLDHHEVPGPLQDRISKYIYSIPEATRDMLQRMAYHTHTTGQP